MDNTHFGYQPVTPEEKTARVQGVFHSVAKRYNLMNDLMSLGLHRLWKRLALARCLLRPGQTVLDLATGTGDLAHLIAPLLGQRGRLALVDMNASMLSENRTRLLNRGILQGVDWVQANAEYLPFPTNHFDCITLAFGLRNMTHIDRALSEIHRVLNIGGRVVILEFSHPTGQPLKALYDFYSFTALPALGQWICQDPTSYRYLAESIRMHPNQDCLKTMMETAGLEHCNYQNIHGGIVAIHVGLKL